MSVRRDFLEELKAKVVVPASAVLIEGKRLDRLQRNEQVEWLRHAKQKYQSLCTLNGKKLEAETERFIEHLNQMEQLLKEMSGDDEKQHGRLMKLTEGLFDLMESLDADELSAPTPTGDNSLTGQEPSEVAQIEETEEPTLEPSFWIQRSEENDETFEELKEALRRLYYSISDSDIHHEQRDEILSILAMLQASIDHHGIHNWAGVYAGEILEQAARDAAYELARDSIKDVCTWLAKLAGKAFRSGL